MKHANIDEFVSYVENLKLETIEDVVALVEAYYKDYENEPEENVEAKNLAWMKYVVLTSKYSMTFVEIIKLLMDFEGKSADTQ